VVLEKLIFFQIVPGIEDDFSALISFDNENSVKTALILNGNKLNDSKLVITGAPSPIISNINEVPEGPQNNDIFASIMTEINSKLQTSMNDIKTKVNEIDNDLKISTKIQEISTDVGNSFTNAFQFIDTTVLHPIKLFGSELFQNLGNIDIENNSTGSFEENNIEDKSNTENDTNSTEFTSTETTNPNKEPNNTNNREVPNNTSNTEVPNNSNNNL